MKVQYSAGIATATSTGNTFIYQWRCFFIKPFRTLDEQLNILHKRGLHISDYPRAKRYLLTNNYYNVINGYSKFFMDNESNNYLPGASFNEIARLYYFDIEIRAALFNAVLTAENHIKYITAYKYAHKYQNETYSYLDKKNYSKQQKEKYIDNVISNFQRIIDTNKHRKKDNSINHYKNEHDDIPIWVIIDYLDFGSLYYFIRNLPEELINDIAKVNLSFLSTQYSINEPFTQKRLLSYIDNIRQLRNVCAHSGRLLKFQTYQHIAYYPTIHLVHNIEKQDSRRSVYDIFLILAAFLSKVEYGKLHNTILKRIKNLDKQLNSISINTILSSLGFPEEWHLTTEKKKH
ncbi:Abi family protein [Dolosigranulum pigrum]|uniref:Abi family protein n=1 Tax=Dolosigranulum pigrum TaxID=29394 RepID=UPI001FCB872F|nr:Abi family protein [Dolosigranulum pigrum]